MYVPSSPDDIIGMKEWEHLVHGSVDGIAATIVAQFHRGCQEEGAVIVGILCPVLGFPSQAEFVGNGASDASADIYYICGRLERERERV